MGGGFRMGSTCTPVADSCQCMAKPIQCCKVKKKKNKKRKSTTTKTLPVLMRNNLLSFFSALQRLHVYYFQ